ncbi:MAG: PAS domain S-box protein [Lamprobacter sp.]|uniref:sensor domain-containing protein n=1 Tax=Lamprobacter sp. TaxID=3100796 RepID=UPI002B25ECE9|nr:PAS domain S-box protein [Lamprobacter sp.]MEA3639480.1 PAS domain S-box protein [Lamprobacter sp.]
MNTSQDPPFDPTDAPRSKDQRADQPADLALADFRERALDALRQGRFDLAEDLIASGDVNLNTLIENVRIYQAELEIQNEELVRSQESTHEALERFTALFHSAPVAALVIDRHGLVISANPAATRLFGLRDLRVHHHFLLRLVSERDRNSFLATMRQLTQGDEQEVEQPEMRFATTEGREFFGELHGAQLPPTREGEPRLLCVVVDRTAIVRQQHELRHAYDRLASSQEAYHVLAEYSPDWDYWINPEGDFVHVSPGCRQITGYSASAFLDDPSLVAQLIHPEDRAQWQQHLAEIQSKGSDDHEVLLLRIQHRDGGLRWIEHECRAVLADDGRYLGRRGVNRDVTERRNIEESVRELRNMLVDAERIAKAGAWSWRLGDDLIQVSPGWQRIHGASESAYSWTELSREFVHPEDREQINQLFEQALTQGSGYQLEHRIQRGDDGGIRWVRTQAEPIKNAAGTLEAIRGTSADITAEIEAKYQLEESEKRFRALFESAAEGMLVMQAGRFTEINQAALRMLGYQDAAAVLGKSPEHISPALQPDGKDTATKSKQLLAEAQGNSVRFEWMHQQADGSPLPVEVTLVPVNLDEDSAYFVHWHDRTEEAKARHRERQASTVFENSSEAIMVTDAEQRLVAVNRAFSDISGYQESEVVGRRPDLLSSGQDDAALCKSIWLAIEHRGSWRGEIWNRRKDGEIYPARMTISSVRDDHGQVTNYIGIFNDISDAKRSEEELYRLAHSDALTGLPNRTLLRARMEQSLQHAKREKQMLALLFIDLDLFKNVNDSLGHSVGDELLQDVAMAIQSEVRESDTLARLGGDEFVILMEAIEDPASVAQLAQRLCEKISQPLQVGERELQVTASIGVSLFPSDGQSMDSLLSNADMAMYRAKDHGRNTYRFFEAEMTERAMQRLRHETALRGALTRGELSLLYQPQVQLNNAQIHGAEALLRWTHPELGAVSPLDFIPIAEEIGLISELGKWVLEQACKQLIAWDAEGFQVHRLAVNISVQQVERIDLVDEIREIFQRTGVAPERFELEVTESMLMRNVDRVIANLSALRDLGITIAVDDFGSGFSSLGYLKTLPISRLKIDKTFVDGVTVDDNDDAIARAIIALGKALGLDVIAEGVETSAQAAFLEHEGCNEAQGYLFGRPMKPDELHQLSLERG